MTDLCIAVWSIKALVKHHKTAIAVKHYIAFAYMPDFFRRGRQRCIKVIILLIAVQLGHIKRQVQHFRQSHDGIVTLQCDCKLLISNNYLHTVSLLFFMLFGSRYLRLNGSDGSIAAVTLHHNRRVFTLHRHSRTIL